MRLRRALSAAGVPVALFSVLLTAGCGDTTSARSVDPGSAPTSSGPSPDQRRADRPSPDRSSSAVPAPTPPASQPADPDHAVDPPGPLRETLLGADMLVFSQDSLSPETVESIRALRGVTAVEPLAMAQVSIENKVLNLAAVDPASYRRFTPLASAQLQAVWDRVAGGELAILPTLKKQLPADKAGYLRLGNDKDAPELHIGAFAPQMPQVDAVINEKWGETLGMKPGNALVVSTGLASPQSVREPIEEVAGADASVQILGPDLDISVQQTAFLVGSVADAVGTFNYTVLGGGRIAPDPAWVSAHVATGEVPILGAVTCNRLIFPQLRAALSEIVSRGLGDEINPGEYAGCYYPRFIAGSTSLSNHSFGLALDLNVPGNLRGTVGEMDRTVVSIFEKWGFSWGGDWRYTDPMHFEMNAVVAPR